MLLASVEKFAQFRNSQLPLLPVTSFWLWCCLICHSLGCGNSFSKQADCSSHNEEDYKVSKHSKLALISITSRCIRRIFRFGDDEVGIENIERSEIFQRSESSAVAMTQPAGWGGKTYEVNILTKSHTDSNLHYRPMIHYRQRLNAFQVNQWWFHQTLFFSFFVSPKKERKKGARNR